MCPTRSLVLYPHMPNNKAHPLRCTRSSARAQRSIHACQMVSTPAQVHPLKCTRSALYPGMLNGKDTRSSAPAQHCIHACQMVSAPAQHCVHACQVVSTLAQVPVSAPQAHPLSTVSMHAKWKAHPLKRTRSQHCIHACQMVSTPAQSRPLSVHAW